jgi:hypothetical protein
VPRTYPTPSPTTSPIFPFMGSPHVVPVEPQASIPVGQVPSVTPYADFGIYSAGG